MTWLNASASVSARPVRRSRRLASAARASLRATASLAASVRDFDKPPTIINNDTPMAPAIAAAVPPPGVGSGLESASRKPDTGCSANLDIGNPTFLDDAADDGRADANHVGQRAVDHNRVHLFS